MSFPWQTIHSPRAKISEQDDTKQLNWLRNCFIEKYGGRNLSNSFSYPENIYNTKAASRVVPFLFDLFHPSSVVDVGCGTGSWLSVFEALGVEDVIGVDFQYSDKSVISRNKFMVADLSQPLELTRRFDLVLCLEVAEHISDSCADGLVESLTNLGDRIVFSAAVPGQGGDGHINEQWPDYWVKKFARYKFHFSEILRSKFWNDEEIEWWYRQNMFLVTSEPIANNHHQSVRAVVHPRCFEQRLSAYEMKLSALNAGRVGLRIAIRILFNAIIYRLRGK